MSVLKAFLMVVGVVIVMAGLYFLDKFFCGEDDSDERNCLYSGCPGENYRTEDYDDVGFN